MTHPHHDWDEAAVSCARVHGVITHAPAELGGHATPI